MKLQLTISCLLLAIATSVAAQEYAAPRTEHGYPDLQGLWRNSTMTPLERPLHLGNRRAYSEEEVQALIDEALEFEARMTATLDPNRPPPPVGGIIDQTADANFETVSTEIARVGGEWRTSLIVDPANGRLPFRESWQDIHGQWRDKGLAAGSGPEARSVLDRCLSGAAAVPLISRFGGYGLGNPAGDNPVRNVQIVQNRDYVVILGEYFSLVRIIPLRDEFLNQPGPMWMGESIAYYDGNSLVVRSRNFRPEQSTPFLRISDEFELTETYSLVGDNEILLRYTAFDPKIYSRPFTAEIPLSRMPAGQKLYEYSCHEGNYSMPSMLRAARIEELGYYD